MIHVHVGQCGCQLGDEFWSQMQRGFLHSGEFPSPSLQSSRLTDSSAKPTSLSSVGGSASEPHKKAKKSGSSLLKSSGKPPSPAVFVDSEPKVVQNLRCPPRSSNIIFEQSGRGNNWAFGFQESEKLCDLTLEAVRQEVERRPSVVGFNMVHGLSGGTGSGLGSRVIAQLREEYPKLFLLTTSVGGSNFGDTCLQPYNTLLTLKALEDNADAICYYSNDEVGELLRSEAKQTAHSVTGRGGGGGGGRKEPFVFTVPDTNRLMARGMVGLFAPTTGSSHNIIISGGGSSGSSTTTHQKKFDAGGFVTAVAPFSSAKYVYVRSALQPRNSILSSASPARALADEVSRAFKKYRHNTQPVHNFAAFWVARGDVDISAPAKTSASARNGKSKQQQEAPAQLLATSLREEDLFHPLSREIMKKMPFASWNPHPATGVVSRHEFTQTKGRISGSIVDSALTGEHHTVPSLTLAVNRSSIVDELERLHGKANALLSMNAYVHWFERYGCDRTQIVEAVESASATISSYEELASDHGSNSDSLF